MAQIYGELVRAQLQSSATDLTPTATGLVYFNTSTGLKWYTGSAWKIAVDLDSTQTLAGKTLDATCSVNASALPIVTAAKGGLGTDASAFTGVLKASAGVFSATTVTNTDISASAAIAFSKLASLSSANLIVGSSTNVPTARAITGDVTIGNTGVTAIAAGVIVDNDVSASAAIAGTKISPDFGSQNVTTTGSLTGTNVINGGYEEFAEIASPSTPAAGKVRVYAKADGKMYQLDDGGNEKAIGSGSGSGGVNYLVDWYDATKAVGIVSTVAAGGNVTVSGSFPSVTSAWYADATSGAAAIASSSDNTLRSTANYLTALSGVSTSGATFVQSPVFNIDGKDLGSALTVQFDVSGNTTDNDWDVVAVRYNSSGVYQELIPIAGNVSTMTGTPSAKLPLGVKQFNGFFITGSTASDVYAIRWRRRAGSAQIRLDSLTVGPNQVLQGAIVTDWQTYTPTSTFTTNSNTPTGRYRRVGDSMEVEIRQSFTGTPNSTTFTISLPSGFTIDTTKIVDPSVGGSIFGAMTAFDGANAYTGNAVYASTTTLRGYGPSNVANWTQAVPFAFGTGDVIEGRFTVPISEWQSNTQQAARAVEEYAANDGTSNIYGPAGTSIAVAIAAGGATRTVTWQTPQLPTDKIELEVDLDGVGRWVSLPAGSQAIQASSGALVAAYNTSTDVGVIVVPSATNNSQCEVRFRQYRNATTSWTTLTNGRWRLRKVSSGAAVGFPVGARNVVGDTTGTTVPAGYIGEHIESVAGSDVNMGSSTQNITSITLTTGVWNVHGIANINKGTATLSSTNWEAYITLNSASSAGTTYGQSYTNLAVPTVNNSTAVLPLYRRIVVSAATQVVYLAANAPASSGNALGRGSIMATRIA